MTIIILDINVYKNYCESKHLLEKTYFCHILSKLLLI